MDRNSTLRWVRFGGHGPFKLRVHAPHGDAVGATVEIDVSTEEEFARRQGMPVPWWEEYVVVEPRELPPGIHADADVLYVRHRDHAAYTARIFELLKHKA